MTCFFLGQIIFSGAQHVCVRLNFNVMSEATRIGADLVSIQFHNLLESVVPVAIYLQMPDYQVRLMLVEITAYPYE